MFAEFPRFPRFPRLPRFPRFPRFPMPLSWVRAARLCKLCRSCRAIMGLGAFWPLARPMFAAPTARGLLLIDAPLSCGQKDMWRGTV